MTMEYAQGPPTERPIARLTASAQFVDSPAGANAIRASLAAAACALYLSSPDHRAHAWQFCELVFALHIPIFAAAIFVPPIRILYQFALCALVFILRSADTLLFFLPRSLLRRLVGPHAAFWLALFLQVGSLGAGGFYLKRNAGAWVTAGQPAQFGPAVLKRLRGHAARISSLSTGNRSEDPSKPRQQLQDLPWVRYLQPSIMGRPQRSDPLAPYQP